MASGQPENKLTVAVRYPGGQMHVHVHEVLARTGKRIRVDCLNEYGVVVGYKHTVDYSIRNCRKLFKFMVRWLEQDVLEQVDQYVKDNNEKLYKEWARQRKLGGR